MIQLRELTEDNYPKLIDWNQNKDANFLSQWAGRGYTFPLTLEQIRAKARSAARLLEADILHEMIGTIELNREEEPGTIMINRFLLSPDMRNKGYGTKILEQVKQLCKDELMAKKCRLCVFEYNRSAYRCYEKCGFFETSRFQIPSGEYVVNMDCIL